MNVFLRNLAGLCADDPLAEKWLFAPSKRVGRQWLDRIATFGTSVLNTRTKTLDGVAADLASMARPDGVLPLLTRQHRVLIVAGLLKDLLERGRYFSKIEVTWSTAKAFASLLMELKSSGLSPGDLDPLRFHPREKGEDIVWLFGSYEEALKERGYMDEADMYKAAVQEVRSKANDWPNDLILLVPEGLDMSVLQRSLLDSFPAGRVKLVSEQVGSGPDETELVKSAGPVFEIREVLRKGMALGARLDEMEMVLADYRGYAPLVFEEFCHLFKEGSDTLPVTFAEGLPASLFRPARALRAWLGWVASNEPQHMAEDMLKAGLLKTDSDWPSQRAMAAGLRNLPIYQGADRYLEVISSRRMQAEKSRGHDPVLEALEVLFTGLIDSTCRFGKTDDKGLLESAANFLDGFARSAGELEALAGQRLVERINEMVQALEIEGATRGFDAMSWLKDLPDEVMIGAMGPRQGRLYVTSLRYCGHSGRRVTAFLGMDDSRFPGGGGPDPLLLDPERQRISNELELRGNEPTRQEQAFREAVSNLEGTVLFSYTAWDSLEERELFLSPVLADFLGRGTADFGSWLESVPFAVLGPPRPDLALEEAEVWALGLELDPEDVRALLWQRKPLLERGFEAGRARSERALGKFDGFIGPDSGYDAAGCRMSVSASMLESYVRCPFDFFIRYVLGAEQPEDHVPDPSKWLDPIGWGRFVHAMLKGLVQIEMEGGEPEAALDSILEELVARFKQDYPVLDEQVFRRDVLELRDLASAFLLENKKRKDFVPVFLEVDIGRIGVGGGPLSEDSVRLSLPGGVTACFTARLDRIDKVLRHTGDITDEQAYVILDYKTGSAESAMSQDPFDKGRSLQGVVYTIAAEQVLKANVSPNAKVKGFGYWFIGSREWGSRVEWTKQELEPGAGIVAAACKAISNGCFPVHGVLADSGKRNRYDSLADLLRFADTDGSASAKIGAAISEQDQALGPYLELLEQIELASNHDKETRKSG